MMKYADERSPLLAISASSSIGFKRDSFPSLTSSSTNSERSSMDEKKRLTVVIPMYREIAEVKTALRSCIDFHSYGYGKDFFVNIVVIIDGCTVDNDCTLQSLQLELSSNGETLGDSVHDEEFGCLSYSTKYGTMPLEVLVKGCIVQKGKRFSQILAFDYLSAHHLPDVVILQDCDTYFPPSQMHAAVTAALKEEKIVCPQILVSSNVFYESILPILKGANETILRYIRVSLQRIGCCPILPGPIVVYPYDSLKALMELYAKEVPHEKTVFFGNKMLTEDSYMGWCATAAGLVPALDFSSCHAYSNLPTRFFPLLRQRRRWKAGQTSTSIIGHEQLEIEPWRVLVMKTYDVYHNIFLELLCHFWLTMFLYALAVEYVGDYILFFFTSHLLRSILCSCVNDANDIFFLTWTIMDSLAPYVLLVWMPQSPVGQINRTYAISACAFTGVVVALYALKCGVGTAANILLATAMAPAVWELQFYETEYAFRMFEDIAWGNREITSVLPVTKLEIQCKTSPKDKIWAGSQSTQYKKTCGSTLMTLSPLFYRLLIIALLWFKVVPVWMSANILLFAPFMIYSVPFFELLVASRSTQQRSYETGSDLKLLGPILKQLDLKDGIFGED